MTGARPPRLFLTTRSLFLRDVNELRRLLKLGAPIDFWLAMASDIPEIQDIALSTMSFDNVQITSGDMGQINWTTELFEKLERTIEALPIPRGMTKDLSEYYKCYLYAKIITKFETITVENNDIEMIAPTLGNGHSRMDGKIQALISIGYVYPFLEGARSLNGRCARSRNIWRHAISYARKELIDAFSVEAAAILARTWRVRDPSAFSRPMIQRVRSILDDPNTMKRISPELEQSYRILAGEVEWEKIPPNQLPPIGLPYPQDVIILHGIPGPTGSGRYKIKDITVHGYVFYLPGECGQDTSRHNPAANVMIVREAYRVGHWIGTLPDDWMLSSSDIAWQ